VWSPASSRILRAMDDDLWIAPRLVRYGCCIGYKLTSFAGCLPWYGMPTLGIACITGEISDLTYVLYCTYILAITVRKTDRMAGPEDGVATLGCSRDTSVRIRTVPKMTAKYLRIGRGIIS